MKKRIDADEIKGRLGEVDRRFEKTLITQAEHQETIQQEQQVVNDLQTELVKLQGEKRALEALLEHIDVDPELEPTTTDKTSEKSPASASA